MTSKRHSNAILIPRSSTLSKSLKQLITPFKQNQDCATEVGKNPIKIPASKTKYGLFY